MTFRPERKIDDSGAPWFRPNQWAGWAAGTLPNTYQEAVERLHVAVNQLGAIPHLEDQLAKLRARSARQTAHAARLERRVVRQRDALLAAERWKAEGIELLGKWDQVHEALGGPAQLGESKAEASLAEAARLRSIVDVVPSPATLRAAVAALRSDNMPNRADELNALADLARPGGRV